jgi:hypothetical protein
MRSDAVRLPGESARARMIAIFFSLQRAHATIADELVGVMAVET